MNHSIAGKNIKQHHIGTASTGVQLNEVVSGGSNLLPRGSLEGCAARGDVLPLQGGAGHHVPQQCLL